MTTGCPAGGDCALVRELRQDMRDLRDAINALMWRVAMAIAIGTASAGAWGWLA